MAKLANYSGVNTNGAFRSAMATVFGGVNGKKEQIQQLIIASVNKASEANDFDWLSQIAVSIEETKCLNLKLFASWVKAHIVAEVDGKVVPALEWQTDKRSFKLAQKGMQWKCLPITVKWFEMGKPPKMEDVYSLVGSIEKLLSTAASKAKKGELSASDTELLNRIAGVTAQYKTEQMSSKMAAQAADPASF